MKALVTGATGFLGRHLIAELLRRGDDVTAVVRPSTELPPDLSGGVELVRADLRRPSDELASRLTDLHAIYHVAAGLGGTWRTMFETNVAATQHLVDAIEKAEWRGRFVHVSSFAVYGLNQVPSGGVVDESVPLEPRPGERDDYAWTKLLQERVVRRLEQPEGPELVVVRPGTIYGRERQFQHRVGRQVGDRLVLMFGGRNLLPLNYVENAAALLAECGRHPSAPGETFNGVDPEPLTQWGYLRRWRRAQQRHVAVLPVPLTALFAAGRLLELASRASPGTFQPPTLLRPYAVGPTLRPLRFARSRAETVLGWHPPVGLDEALAKTFPQRRVMLPKARPSEVLAGWHPSPPGNSRPGPG